MITEPSTSSRAFLRKRDAIAAQLQAVVDRLPPRKREAAIDAGSIRTIQYERYRRNGVTRLRRARGQH